MYSIQTNSNDNLCIPQSQVKFITTNERGKYADDNIYNYNNNYHCHFVILSVVTAKSIKRHIRYDFMKTEQRYKQTFHDNTVAIERLASSSKTKNKH